jgi:hypothetical protein
MAGDMTDPSIRITGTGSIAGNSIVRQERLPMRDVARRLAEPRIPMLIAAPELGW